MGAFPSALPFTAGTFSGGASTVPAGAIRLPPLFSAPWNESNSDCQRARKFSVVACNGDKEVKASSPDCRCPGTNPATRLCPGILAIPEPVLASPVAPAPRVADPAGSIPTAIVMVWGICRFCAKGKSTRLERCQERNPWSQFRKHPIRRMESRSSFFAGQFVCWRG